jgi:Na+/H+ antiporter NhaD/arsenite permease-like protein
MHDSFPLLQIGIVTFFLSAVLDNLTSTIVMVSLLRKLVPPSEYRKYETCYIIYYVTNDTVTFSSMS